MAAGRPREFDVDRALDAALKVFWQKGFDGASLLDLTAAMGINRPSLYAAFGNKESLFRKAIERYVEQAAVHLDEALAEPTARGAVASLWAGNIDLATEKGNPRGCFLVQSALACGDEADCLRKEVAKRRGHLEAALRKRFQRAVAEGDLPGDCVPADLARFVASVTHGLAIQAAGGAAAGDLHRVAQIALRALPSL